MAEALHQPKLERTKEIKLPAAVLALAMTPDGATAFAACLDGGVYSVDTATGTSNLLGKHESYASGVVWLAEPHLVVSAGYDGTLMWHDLAGRRVVRTVKAHQFWSWDLSASRDGQWVASVTGQYLSGGYRYEPAPEREPSVRIFEARTGELRQSLPHVPPVQAVAFSPDSRHVAAGNLMGEVRVWEVASGKEVSHWKTDDLTSWGVIKSHHFLGGVFSMQFHPDGKDLYVCGMGPMVDPMAGNGVQRWQRFDWLTGKRLDQTHDGESGQGLMEALAFHPGGKLFAMAGRLFQGKWNLALFEVDSGKNLFAMDAIHRITDAQFTADGSRLVVAKARQQERKDGHWVEFGLIEIYSVQS
jgi:WD40 repeat protein